MVLVPLFSEIILGFNVRPNTITCLVMMGVKEKRRLSGHTEVPPIEHLQSQLHGYKAFIYLCSKSLCTNVSLNNALSCFAS